MAIPEYNYIPKYTKLEVNNKPKDVVTASYWNGLFNSLSNQGDHTAKELGNILNHFSTALAGIENEIAESAEDIANIRGVFRINVTYSNGVYTADKTFNEIKAAYDAGQYPYVVSDSNTIYTLTDCYLATEQMAMDFKRYLIGADTLEDDTLRIYSYTTANGSNIVRQNTEFNIPIEVLEVTLTTQNGVSVADKTFAQVETAIYDGIPVLKVHSNGELLWFFLLDKSPTEIDFIGLVDEQTIAYLTAKQDDTWEATVAARVTAEMLSSLNDKIGNIGQLTTTDKANLVAAVNEVKQTADDKQDKLIAGENITIAADGKTISATGGGSSVPKPLTYDYMPEGYPTKVMGVPLLKEQVVAFTLLDGIYAANIPNPSEIVEGQTYTVNWDGAEYECVCGILNSNPVIGNLSITGGGDDTGEPFLYMYTASESAGQFGTLDTSASHTIAIKKQGEGIIPMAYYYMPEGYPKKTIGTATVMEEQEFSFEPDEGGRYMAVIPSAFEIVLGNTYIVKWDGTEYECVSFPIDQNEYAFGNIFIFGVGADSGVPFVYVPSYGGIFTLDTSATHTVGIKTTAETTIPMSEEFIPKMNVSAFTNDAGYLTLATLPKYEGVVE